jgi:hypothetical protein
MSDLMVSEATLRINGLARQMRRWKMSDLIERLRSDEWASNATLRREAADEIEALRSYLEEEREKNEKQVRMTMDAHAEIERLRKDRLCRCADEVRCEMKAEIERLRKQKKVAVDALFSICQSDWGIGHSIAKPAHDAIKKLAAVEEQDDE